MEDRRSMMDEVEMEWMLEEIKINLRLKTEDHDRMILDMISDVCSYCNIDHHRIPYELEPIIRRKAQGIIDYEAAMGTGYHPEVQSIKEGDGSVTWAQSEGNTRSGIYQLNSNDRKELKRYRRLRGYA